MRHGSRRWAAAVLGLGVAAGGGAAQPARVVPSDDPAARAFAQQQIAEQKLAAEVDEAIRDADRFARVSKVKAAERLRQAQNAVDTAVVITAAGRKALTDRLQAKAAQLDGRGAAVPATDPALPAVKAANQAAFDRYMKEANEVREGIARVELLQRTNQFAEARQKAAELSGKFPDNPAVLALSQKDTVADRVTEARELSALMDKRIVMAMNDVQRSALPAIGDIEFPKDWKQRTARRTTELQLSEREKKIIKSLDTPITLAVNDRPFEEAMQQLSNAIGQDLLLDTKSLEDAGTDLKRPVNFAGKGLAARTFLRQMLAAQGLTYVVKDEAIQVVTAERARNMLVTRAYYLGDVVSGTGPFGGAVTWGPLLDYQQTMENVRTVMEAITSSIEPLSWKEKGGPGAVSFHFPSMSIIVRQSAEVHAVLGSKIGTGR